MRSQLSHAPKPLPSLWIELEPPLLKKLSKDFSFSYFFHHGIDISIAIYSTETSVNIWRKQKLNYSLPVVSYFLTNINYILFSPYSPSTSAALDEVCWVLNVRGSDISHCPTVISYLAVTSSEAIWFVNQDQVSQDLLRHQIPCSIF